ncbi:hypothetical protein FALBO_5720 [Fusarium albosuccineum]|uniref:Apple domain-containing protein n=1 Tax=Fusarium albosuccineum TaxID=1237068 RepID=A0A8H4LED8_9HYPO|nr:hypothetical protein FALBO_5720 [Fusarium albosuccineum]
MFSSQLVGVFTLLLLKGTDAAVLRRSDPSCSILNARPSSLACGRQGYINNDSGKLGDPSAVPSATACADRCATTSSCTFFNFRPESGFCQLFSGDFASIGHREEPSGSYFSQLACFACQNSDTLLWQNFEDGDVSKWSMNMDKDGDFFFDIQQQDSKAFRVLEATNSGTADVIYTQPFHLEPGSTYRISYLAKSNNKAIQPFDLLRTRISRGEEVIYESFPEYPADYPVGWTQFFSKFTVGEGKGGSATFSFRIIASGSQIDWYFDGISVQKI